MGQRAEPKDIEVTGSNDKIPGEVADGKGLYHAGSARVSPDALLPVHIAPLVVGENDPGGEGANEGALDHGYDVNIPTKPLGARKFCIVLGNQERREHG